MKYATDALQQPASDGVTVLVLHYAALVDAQLTIYVHGVEK